MAVRVTTRDDACGADVAWRSERYRAALSAAALAAALLPLAACSPEPPSGAAIYQVRCAFCHGDTGHGDGAAGRRMQPTPADFATPAFWATHTPGQLRTAILRGVPGTPMPGYEGTLSDAQLTALVRHLESFRPEEPRPSSAAQRD